jgi:5-methylcytosine-specific restriction endonuclease McrA
MTKEIGHVPWMCSGVQDPVMDSEEWNCLYEGHHCHSRQGEWDTPYDLRSGVHRSVDRGGRVSRRAISLALRFAVLKRDRFSCAYCGRSASAVELQIDHHVPVSSGGSNTFDNLRCACVDCNLGKSGDSPETKPDGYAHVRATKKGLEAARERGVTLGRPRLPQPTRECVIGLRSKGLSWAQVSSLLGCTVAKARRVAS